MGSLLLSTLGTLSSQAYYLFLLVIAIGFFGVYIPLNERKKRRGAAKNPQKPPPKERKPSPPLRRAGALRLLAACLPLTVAGLTLLIAASVMSAPVPTILGALFSGVGLTGISKAGRDFRAAPRTPTPQPPVREPADRSRLEQLETLREAGVLDKKEYELEKQKLEEVKK